MFSTQRNFIPLFEPKQCGAADVDAACPCPGVCWERQNGKEQSKEKNSLKREKSEVVLEMVKLFFLTSNLRHSPRFTRLLVEKSWRVFLAFSPPAAWWKNWPCTALCAHMSFFIFSLSFFLPLSLSFCRRGDSHCSHFIHTFHPFNGQLSCPFDHCLE